MSKAQKKSDKCIEGKVSAQRKGKCIWTYDISLLWQSVHACIPVTENPDWKGDFMKICLRSNWIQLFSLQQSLNLLFLISSFQFVLFIFSSKLFWLPSVQNFFVLGVWPIYISKSLVWLVTLTNTTCGRGILVASSSFRFLSVQFSHSVVSDSLRPHESQYARPPCPSPTPGVHSDSCTSSRWCHPAISSSVVPFSSWPQSLPASESFPMSQLFKVHHFASNQSASYICPIISGLQYFKINV